MTDSQATLFDIEPPSEKDNIIEENLTADGEIDLDSIIDGVAAGVNEKTVNKPQNSGKAEEELPVDKDRIVFIYGKQHIITDRSLSLDQIRKWLQKKYYPELSKDRTEMEYDKKTGHIYPRIKSAKRGSGRKLFLSSKELVANPAKVVSILAAQDGYYEVRRTEIGVFSVRTHNVSDLDSWFPGFKCFLPKIPYSLLSQAIAFMRRLGEVECMLQFFWDRAKNEYFMYCPVQNVTDCTVDANRDGPEKDHLLVLDLHSHNSMKPDFSAIDNMDENETRIYGIVGRTDRYFPEIKVRICAGGNHHEISPWQIFDEPFRSFPKEWEEKVSLFGGANDE